MKLISSIFVDSIGITYMITLFMNRYFMFLPNVVFISLSSLIALPEISCAMLNRCGEIAHPYLVANLRIFKDAIYQVEKVPLYF